MYHDENVRIQNVIFHHPETCVQSYRQFTIEIDEHLGTILKLSIGAAIIGIGILVYRAAKYAIANFDFQIVGYGKPTVNNSSITVPIQIQFTNPTPIPINIDQLLADIYIKKNTSYVKAATINQALSIPPGKTTQIIYPVIDINSIFGGSLIDTLTAITQSMQSKMLSVRTDVKVIYKGIPLPTQSFTQDTPLT